MWPSLALQGEEGRGCGPALTTQVAGRGSMAWSQMHLAEGWDLEAEDSGIVTALLLPNFLTLRCARKCAYNKKVIYCFAVVIHICHK